MTNDFRVSEIYVSAQGEGPRTGQGTCFVRFGGCNLRCPGWPCDTLYAVDPAYRRDWRRRDDGEVLSSVLFICQKRSVRNVCLTGGEPFIQPNASLDRLVDGLHQNGLSVEVFTNGQVHYPEWAFERLNFIMDWKLGGSGNPAAKTPDTLDLMLQNISQLKQTDAIKFVIGDMEDFNEALETWCRYEQTTLAQWWAGIVWGGKMTNEHLVDLIQSECMPWALNVQVHKHIWPPTKRGV
jgi:7-carboxy-7-deazaguanine synthase